MTHKIKLAPRFFNDIYSGKKPFECRKNDRDYQTGDILVLQEWSPATEYTGREITREVSYVLYGGVFGIQEGHCVMGIVAVGNRRQYCECNWNGGCPHRTLRKESEESK